MVDSLAVEFIVLKLPNVSVPIPIEQFPMPRFRTLMEISFVLQKLASEIHWRRKWGLPIRSWTSNVHRVWDRGYRKDRGAVHRGLWWVGV